MSQHLYAKLGFNVLSDIRYQDYQSAMERFNYGNLVTEKANIKEMLRLWFVQFAPLWFVDLCCLRLNLEQWILELWEGSLKMPQHLDPIGPIVLLPINRSIHLNR